MKHTALAAFLVSSLASFAISPAMAQDKPVNLRISLWIPASLPLVPAYTAWGASMQKASGGTITSTVFPAEQLGKAFDHYDMARDGIADVAYVNPGYQPGRFPVIALGQIPFTFADGHSGTQAIDAFYRKYAETEMKDVHFCFAFIHDPGTLHSRVKVTTPEDLKGVRVRPAQSTVGQMVTLLGGTNVQASAPESRDAIERGVADAIFFPWNSMFNFGIDKVVKYHIDAPLYTSVFVTVMNKAKYDPRNCPAPGPISKPPAATRCASSPATNSSP
jgi:TRAP-type C4-dicarboxylate transport system substrate-binding protein